MGSWGLGFGVSLGWGWRTAVCMYIYICQSIYIYLSYNHRCISRLNVRSLGCTYTSVVRACGLNCVCQVVVEWGDGDEASVVSLAQQLPHHLTAAVVSRQQETLQYFLGQSLSGTTYAGIRARTTGAPQNHFFGPGADPRGASIGTAQAIRQTWTFHRQDTPNPKPS